MSEATNDSWRKSVRACVARSEFADEFAFCSRAQNAPSPERPLLIIVHPGDAIEDGIGFAPEDREKVIQFGRKNALGMAAEIEEKMKTHDVVILHRQSSVDTFMRHGYSKSSSAALGVKPYSHACLRASTMGTVLCGDDLEEASKWIIENLQPDQRPEIFMTGAYACSEMGCITAVGKKIQEACDVHIEVSSHAPTDNSNSSPRWDPEQTKRVRRPTSRPA